MSLRKRIKSNLKVPAALAVTLCLSILSLIELTTNNTTALEFQTDTSGDNAVKLDFTFGETLNITTSGNTVAIPELTPGHSGVSASNYTVTVNTNAQAGYTLSATVGCSSSDTNYNTSCYDSTSLSDGTNTFDMIAADGTLSAGEWGIALVNTETVSSFKTLAKWDGTATVLNQTVDASGTAASGYAGNSATPFRIGAAATNSQEAGTYQNRINFIAVANVACQSTISGTMQDFDPTNLCDDATGSLTDSRGGTTKSYTVAKLADGKWWMTTNLDLPGGSALSADDTDVTSTYISGFTTQSNLTKSGNTIVLPASSPTGTSVDGYYTDDALAYVTNSGSTTCASNSPCYSYYSWIAATLGSGRSIEADNTNAPYSICPKGWKLPTTYDGSGTAAEATDFRKLMIALGGSNSVQTYTSSTSPTGATMYGKLIASPYNFLLAGNYRNGSFDSGGSNGFYWSATSYSSSRDARNLNFYSTGVVSAGSLNRRYGFSVRCVFGS